MLETALIVIAAIILDRILGEPRRYHPLVGFGYLVTRIEQLLSSNTSSPVRQRLNGAAAVALAIIPIAALGALLLQLPYAEYWLSTLALYLSLGGKSLEEHALAIARPLAAGDLTEARTRVGYIVSRDTSQLNESEISKAAVESVLENGADAVFSAIFWFVVAGPIGVLIYRLSNTLDAMWGYKSPRFLHFGWAAARFDDVLNWLPARLCACTYALFGSTRNAFSCWLQQAPNWKSPNAGPVMAAGAGALNCELGGAAIYHGERQARPTLGRGAQAEPADIERAVRLVNYGSWSWAAALISVAIVIESAAF